MIPQEIVAQLENLSPPDKLRLAADLMDARLGHLAYPIANGVVTELGAAIALQRLRADTERLRQEKR